MALRRPLVVVSGVTSELPPGDSVVGAQAGTLVAGSGLNGGGLLDGGTATVNVSLAAAPSGLIFVGDALGLDGIALASANAALSRAGGTMTGPIVFATGQQIATSVNLSGGISGAVPYQPAPNTTAFLNPGVSGQYLATQGSNQNPTWVTPRAGLQSVQVFTSTGTWNRPTGITKIYVKGVGGGGGGGATSAGQLGGAPSGGAGGYFEKLIDVTAVSGVSVTIGAGGAGAAAVSNEDGAAGGTTIFGTYASGLGGQGGTGRATGNAGDGGTAFGGDVNISGGGGAHGIYDQFGGRGSVGGASFFGGGAKAVLSANGLPGQARGSGGGGGTSNTSGGAVYAGGAGAPGIVIVEEY